MVSGSVLIAVSPSSVGSSIGQGGALADSMHLWVVELVVLGVGEKRPDGFAFDDFADVSGDFEVEDEERDFAFLAHGQCGHVHHSEAFLECFFEGEGLVSCGARVFVWIRGVDAVDFGCFEEDVAVEFGCTQRGAGVGGEEGVPGSCGEDDDASLFEVADGSASDEGLGDGADIQGGHDARIDPDGVQFFFEGDGVHDGAEHAHVICGCLLDVSGFCELGAADDVPASHDDGDLGASLGCGFHFIGDGAEFFGGDPESAWRAESFT